MFIQAVEGIYIYLQCVLVPSGCISITGLLDYFEYLILDAWPELQRESIAKSFKLCALDLALDCSEDDKMVCLHKRKSMQERPGDAKEPSEYFV